MDVFLRGPDSVFCWEADRENVVLSYVEVSTDHDKYLELSRELINYYLNDTQLVPRPLGKVSVLSLMEHIPLWQHIKSPNKLATDITTAKMHHC